MLRRREGDRLEAWLVKAEASGVEELTRFAGSLPANQDAVQAGLMLRHSKGQTEGHVTKLKLIKRQGSVLVKESWLTRKVDTNLKMGVGPCVRAESIFMHGGEPQAPDGCWRIPVAGYRALR
jgi:hypothetical protein